MGVQLGRRVAAQAARHGPVAQVVFAVVVDHVMEQGAHGGLWKAWSLMWRSRPCEVVALCFPLSSRKSSARRARGEPFAFPLPF